MWQCKSGTGETEMAQSCCVKRKSYGLKLLPRVAPGPVVCFVLSEPHSHQLIPAVIEDWPVESENRENNAKACFSPGDLEAN